MEWCLSHRDRCLVKEKEHSCFDEDSNLAAVGFIGFYIAGDKKWWFRVDLIEKLINDTIKL